MLRPTHSKSVLPGLAMSLGMLAAVACGGGAAPAASSSVTAAWANVEKQANSEGSVNWWSTNTQQPNQALIQAFQSDYPSIKVNLVQGLPAALETKYQQVVQNNLQGQGPDVWTSSNLPFLYDQKAKGSWFKPDGPDVGKFPAGRMLCDGYCVDSSESGVALTWNTDKFPAGLKTYADILDPKLKGHLGIWVPGTPSVLAVYDHLDQVDSGYTAKLSAQGPFHFYTQAAALAQAIASGEVWAAIGTAQQANNLVVQGAPIKWAYSAGDKPVGFSISAVGLKNASHPNAARLFLNYMASRAGQTALCGHGLAIAAYSGIAGTLPAPANGTTPLDVTRWTPDFTSKFQAQWNATFKYTP